MPINPQSCRKECNLDDDEENLFLQNSKYNLDDCDEEEEGDIIYVLAFKKIEMALLRLNSE